MKSKIFLKALAFCLILIQISCSKKYQTGTIYMGQGGGFAGSFKEYQLNANGDLYFRQNDVDSVFFIKTLDSSATKKIFKKYFKLKLDSDDLDAPGNLYYYIGRRVGKFRNHKITFGNTEAGIDKNTKEYYDEFFEMIAESPKNK